MASLPYPLNRLYTHIVSVIATTQSACILMSVWVWQGCHTLLQIPILLFLKNLFFCLFNNNMFSCSHVFSNNNMFSCLQNNNMFSCSSVFSKTTCSHVFSNNNMFSCSSVFSTTTCSHVLLSFQTTTCSHVLLSFKNNMFFCLSPKRTMFSRPTMSLCRQKKTAESNAPSR